MIPPRPSSPAVSLRVLVAIGRGTLAVLGACEDDIDVALVGVLLQQRLDLDAPTQNEVAARFGRDRTRISRRLARLREVFDAAIDAEV